MSSEIAKLTGWLTQNSEKLQREMPEGYSAEDVKRIALHLMGSSDQLKRCSLESIYQGILKAAHFDLAIDLGEAHLVPYGNTANFQIDYKGLIKLAKRSGAVKHVKAEVVREGDFIEYQRGSDRSQRYLIHQPAAFNEGPIIGAYALFDMADGFTEFEVLSPSDAAAIKKKAAKGSMMWSEFEGEAWKKAVIRRGIKTLELIPEDKRAVIEDDRTSYDYGRAEPRPVVADLNRRFAPKPKQVAHEPDVEEPEVIDASLSDGEIVV